jgi:hypothetical protein
MLPPFDGMELQMAAVSKTFVAAALTTLVVILSILSLGPDLLR